MTLAEHYERCQCIWRQVASKRMAQARMEAFDRLPRYMRDQFNERAPSSMGPFGVNLLVMQAHADTASPDMMRQFLYDVSWIDEFRESAIAWAASPDATAVERSMAEAVEYIRANTLPPIDEDY